MVARECNNGGSWNLSFVMYSDRVMACHLLQSIFWCERKKVLKETGLIEFQFSHAVMFLPPLVWLTLKKHRFSATFLSSCCSRITATMICLLHHPSIHNHTAWDLFTQTCNWTWMHSLLLLVVSPAWQPINITQQQSRGLSSLRKLHCFIYFN